MIHAKSISEAIFNGRKYYHQWEIQQYGKEAAASNLQQEIADLQRIFDELHGKTKKPCTSGD